MWKYLFNRKSYTIYGFDANVKSNVKDKKDAAVLTNVHSWLVAHQSSPTPTHSRFTAQHQDTTLTAKKIQI